MSDYNTKFIKIQDSSLVISKVEIKDREDKKGQNIYINIERPISITSHCEHCGCTDIVLKEYYHRTIKHVPGAFTECFLLLKSRRFKCKLCNKTFTEKFNFIDKNSVISKLLKIEMFERSKVDTFTKTSKDLNISIASVFSEFELNTDISRLKLPEVLCIDEVSVKTEFGTYALILYDPINKKIIDVLPHRDNTYISSYLSKIHYDELNNVKFFITDLYSAYKNIFKNYFIKATHVVDAFHWIKLATQNMNDIRINVMNNFKKIAQNKVLSEEKGYGKFYKLLKNNGRLLTINPLNKPLAFFDLKIKNNPYDNEFTIQEAIEYMINNDEDLYESYCTLQNLYHIATTSTYGTIKERLGEWIRTELSKPKKDIGTFEETARTYKAWFNEIQNSFIIYEKTQKRLSNGNIEGINREIGVIKNDSAGIQKFKIIRAKIMYYFNKKN